MANSGVHKPAGANDKIDPKRAASALKRWRRSVAEAIGQDPGAPLDQPDRKLLMLRVFGATQRLGELCLIHPDAAAAALTDGPSTVLAEAARDLTGLKGGVGGPDALHAALAPLKNRAEIAINLGELGGRWSVADATAARVDFAERLVETALQWLVQAAVKRGELSVEDADNFMQGVFAVAGGDFAHEDLAPHGPVDLILLYDDKYFTGQAARGADRVFVRIGAEFREAFEGKPGEYPLFALRTPLGSGVGGAGYAEAASRVEETAKGPQAQSLKTWLATARIVAGDRTAGGAFLEKIEDLVWGETPILNEELREALEKSSDDPRMPFRRVADLCRLAIGGARPVFRTASARQVFETAAESRAISSDAMRRLCAGEELAHLVVSRLQMIKGAAAVEVTREDEQTALAILCGFGAYDCLAAALDGARIDAENTLRRMMRGTQDEVALYENKEAAVDDVDKLEDLGFINGASLSAAVDEWAKRAADKHGTTRFSAIAPGLLTTLGETQKPEAAIRRLDQLIENCDEGRDVFSLFGEGAPQRDAIIDAFGCFGAAVEPLVGDATSIDFIFDHENGAVPETADEWISRFAPPAITAGVKIEEIGAWRCQTIAKIAYCAASGATSFDAAARALEKIHIRTLADTYKFAMLTAKGEKAAAARDIAVHIYDGAGAHVPGAATSIGFMAGNRVTEAGETFVKDYLVMLDSLGGGVFAIVPDTTHRPGGVSGALVPDVEAFKGFVQSEAVAYEQIMLARGRVVAGESAIADAAHDALRHAVSGARRADILFRDLDRARAQQMRRNRPNSEWDIDRLDGGRMDAELVISSLIYRHAPTHPSLQEKSVDEALNIMARSGLISEDAAKALQSARAFWMRLQVARAFALWSDPVREPVRPRFGAVIARAAGVERYDQVRPLMLGYADDILRMYSQFVLGRPPLSVVAQAAG
ncbi:MAG: hypothetical protein HKP25_03555 [Marinicaulis sp.]|nr:hypothetical protein [Marinicaulis sp.]